METNCLKKSSGKINPLVLTSTVMVRLHRPRWRAIYFRWQSPCLELISGRQEGNRLPIYFLSRFPSTGHSKRLITWWCHQVEAFSTFLALCEGNPPVIGGFPSQRPVAWSFDVFFDVPLNKRLKIQSRCWWFETPWRSLWRHCNE